MSKRLGFTLAEVLITLGVIGVVCAMTIPTLMHNYQNKQFETAFKENFAMLENTYKLYCNDRGNIAPDFRNADDRENFFAYFKTITSIAPQLPPDQGGAGIHYHRAYPFDKSFPSSNSAPRVDYSDCSGDPTTFRILINGSYLYFTGAYSPGILVLDTNGEKPPNRLGYDMFLFASSTKVVYTASWTEVPSDLYGPGNIVLGAANGFVNNQHLNPVTNSTGCAPVSKGGNGTSGSGVTCTYFAIQNKCPWDDTKTYWDSLP